jgi:type VI protein secretion system component Hcp
MRKSLLKVFPAVVTGVVVLAGLQLVGLPAATAPVPAPAMDLSDLQLLANNPALNIFVDFQSPAPGSPLIKGDSVNTAHPQFVEATSVHWAGTNVSTIGSASGGAGSGKFAFDELVLTKGLDKATAPLFMASAKGTHHGKVVITFDKTGTTVGQAAFRITLGLVFVKKVDIGAGPEYSETVTLVFGSARIDYFGAGSTPTAPTNSQAWSIVTNAPATDV